MTRFSARRSALTFLLSFIILCVSLAGFISPREGTQARDHASRAATGWLSSGNTASATHPRLILLIVVDQFRYDYLERFGDLFAPNGIGRLLREGASWSEANHDHVPTDTAAGHAALMTGAWPAQNGIVGNEWYERETGRKVKSITDDTTRLLGGKPGDKGSSPRRLLCSTLGDELRIATRDAAKVIGISAKDRSAILPAGRRASAAYWFDSDTGNIVSSTYYFDRLPDWVNRFNEHHRIHLRDSGLADDFVQI